MDDKRLELKLDQIVHCQNEMQITLAKQQVILDEHIKRSNMLETQMDSVMEHVNGLKGVTKALKILAFLAAIAESIRLFFH